MNAEPEGRGLDNLLFHEALLRWGPAYIEKFGDSMPSRQREALERMLLCRTPELGGRLYQCPDCQEIHYACHSCNDRHCPRCGGDDASQWLERAKERLLLPTPYFLVTFTVPEALRAWIRSHPREGYDLLFSASSKALQDLAGNPKRLNGSMGMLSVLHTWSRKLIYHPHIHCLVPGGALSHDLRQWNGTSDKFLLPVTVLGKRFRNLFADELRSKWPELSKQIPAKVWKQSWVVHSQAAGSGEHALRYLSRYMFKTALGDREIIQRADGKLVLPYKESETGQWKSIAMEPEELIRRFLQHVLPKRFKRVRCYGWFHPAARKRLNRVRALLQLTPVFSQEELQTWMEIEEVIQSPELPTPTPMRCRSCEVELKFKAYWRPGRRAPGFGRDPPT